MISQQGIYTVLGSKPMTEFRIPKLESEEQRKKLYDLMPEEFRKQIPFIGFNDHTEINALWECWTKIQNKYLGNHFRIVFDEEEGFLINIPLVIYILKNHYKDFLLIVGNDFDPTSAINEIGQSSSNFWNKVKNNHYLLGLLFGFGEKNAKLFQWENENLISFPYRVGSDELISNGKKHLSSMYGKIEDLTVPQFIVYQPVDEMVEKYLLEKERILQIFKGKDFAETMVLYLRGEAQKRIDEKKTILKMDEDGQWVLESPKNFDK